MLSLILLTLVWVTFTEFSLCGRNNYNPTEILWHLNFMVMSSLIIISVIIDLFVFS